MANTTLRARIANKYGDYDSWVSENPTLLEGEIAVVNVPEGSELLAQEPAVLLKVGDGISTFEKLPFAQANAADVYDWAKSENKPTYTADEISGLSNFLASETTDTTYKLVQDTDDANTIYLYVSDDSGGYIIQDTVDFPTYTLTTGTANGYVNWNGENVYVRGLQSAAFTSSSAYDASGAASAVEDALNATIGTVTDGMTVVEMIAAAEAAATYDDTDLVNKVNTMIGSDDDLSARAIAEDVLDGSGLENHLYKLVQDTDDASQVYLYASDNGNEYIIQDSISFPSYTLTTGRTNGTVLFNGEVVAVYGLGSAAYKEEEDFDVAGAAAAVEDTLNTLIGDVDEDKTVVEMIKEAQAAATYDDSELTSKVDTLIGSDSEMSVREIATDVTNTAVSDLQNLSAALDELSNVAWTGEIGDLTQASEGYVVFCCGSATENI